MVNEGFPAEGVTTVSAFDNPGGADALVASVLNAPSPEEELPDVPAIDQDEIVPLPGGLLVRGEDGPVLIREAQVRELTGADEEKLARASSSKNPFHFFDTMLESAVVRIGDTPKDKIPQLLKDMLIGDREALILGIRHITYGPEFEVADWMGCPHCEEPTDLTMDLSDEEVVPVRKLEDPVKDREFDVTLRKGAVAHVRLLTGADQQDINNKGDITWARRNSLILQHAVSTITPAGGGTPRSVAAAPSLVVNLGAADRKTILTEIAKRAPGPQYTRITFLHPPCSKEVTLAVGLADLFQG